MAPAVPAGATDPPRWVADEMLGRLARYLRFLGHDTLYVRGLDDASVRKLAESTGRVLLTRDHDLAGRTQGALLLRSVYIVEQLRELRTAYPALSGTVTFDRCPECNDRLRPWVAPPDSTELPAGTPRPVDGRPIPVWVCPGCGRRFWEGSHAPKIRAVVDEAWGGPGSP
ncbi:MAG TPA: Mut7-C RNAse domain-containing protein [Thermoplasmata archaeon]|nr:Mut7-C RNAse domain-containing protein [Thermoplasmata archaeon]